MKRVGFILLVLAICTGFLWGCDGGGSEDITKMTERLERMEKQLNDVQAVKEIEKLQAQYLHYVIYNKLDDVCTLFSEEGVLDVFQGTSPAKGAEEITAIFQERKAMVEKDMEQGTHAVMFDSSPVITVEGDTAKSSFLLFNMMEANEQGLGVQQGAYNLEFVKENGEWKISYLKYTREFSIGGSPAMANLPPRGQNPPGGPAPDASDAMKEGRP